MTIFRTVTHRATPAIAALLGTCATLSLAAEAPLNWTPHRAATTAVEQPVAEAAPVPAADTLPASVAPTSSAAPAAVVLPDNVPRSPQQPVARTAVRRPRPAPAPQGDWSSPNRISGSLQRAFDPQNPNGVFSAKAMRTPQGSVSRPILAPEGQQAVAMQRTAELAAMPTAAERLGGGLAPRYSATTGPRPRIDRIAMNVDGIPSVMTQQPQVGAMDDAGVPGRTPTGAGSAAAAPAPATSQKLPAPSTAPSVTEEMPMQIESFDPGMGGMDGEGMDPTMTMDGMSMGDDGMPMMSGEGGMLMGEYPAQLHVESFYDDPYACEDDDPLCHHSGRFCNWMRQFGRPYYGWRWYRDFTASAGVTAFTNDTNLGLHGNFGTNEYLNFAMPFWNAFGIGWQVGWRGTQTNFQPSEVEIGTTTFTKNARDQNFVTTGFFTRAFEGRGLQGGAVYDFMHDSWLDNANIAQIRAEISYVWGYHEIGFWGAANTTDELGFLGPRSKVQGTASTVDLYTGFYRLQFGDANELKVWGGGTGDGEGIVGTLLRAPLARSFAMEGTFTYLIPGQTRSIVINDSGATSNFSPAAWNVGVNLVYYPAGRSRRGLASPYRPLFEVADNGSMIREFSVMKPKP
jgi:hypothetical protein